MELSWVKTSKLVFALLLFDIPRNPKITELMFYLELLRNHVLVFCINSHTYDWYFVSTMYPISCQVDRESATKEVDSGSIGCRIKKISIHSSLLDVQQ